MVPHRDIEGNTMTRHNHNNTTYYNIDLTIAVRDGMDKTEIENELESIMDLNSDEIRECVMVSKTEEVE